MLQWKIRFIQRYTLIFNHLIEKHNAEAFKIKKLKFCEKKGVLGYTTVNYKFKPLDNILTGKNVVMAEPDRILIKDSISWETPSPRQSKQFRPSSNANTSMVFDSELDSDECGRLWVRARFGQSKDHKIGICCFSTNNVSCRGQIRKNDKQKYENTNILFLLWCNEIGMLIFIFCVGRVLYVSSTSINNHNNVKWN